MRSRSAMPSLSRTRRSSASRWQLGLDLGEHLGVEQLAQLGPAEELGEQSLVEGECGGAPLGDGGVALVHERRDVAEQQRLRERRGAWGVHVDEANSPIGDPAMEVHQRRHVVEVLQDLADGLQDDRERRVASGDREQLRGTLALLPQRRPSTGVAARQQQRSRGALPEPGREQRGATDLGGDDLLDLVGLERDQLRARRVLVGLGDAQHDAVVGGHRLGIHPVALAQPRPDRQRPGRVHRRAVGGVHDEPPVAELVAEALDHELLVVGDGLGGLLLLRDQRDQVGRGPLVEARRRWPWRSPARASSRRPHG